MRAVAAFPPSVVFTQSFLRYVARVNTTARGFVRIELAGGPEAIAALDQGDAVRRGAIDMAYLPGSYYQERVPETAALAASNVTPMEQRANGGLELINRIHQEKLNAYYLGHLDGGVDFHVYLAGEPRLGPAGRPDLEGIRLRAGPAHRELLAGYLGATPVAIPVPEVRAALEKGTVDGVGWPIVGLMDLGWDEIVRYRIDPGFLRTDIGIIVNLDRWKALSPGARLYLERAAIAFERESFELLQDRQAQEAAEMARRGMQIVELAPAAARELRETAAESAWQRLKERDSTYYDALRAKLYR